MELAALESLKHQCLHFFSVGIDLILFKVGGYIDMHNILHEFEFWPNGTTDYGVSCPDGSQVSDRCPLGYLFTLSVMIWRKFFDVYGTYSPVGEVWQLNFYYGH